MTKSKIAQSSASPVERMVSKNFLLFGGEFYYARGGAHDFLGAFDTIEEASLEGERQMEGNSCQDIGWWHVFDISKGEIVVKNGSQAYGAD